MQTTLSNHDILRCHMLPYLNLKETIGLLFLNKKFNLMVHQRKEIKVDDIFRLHISLNSWKNLKRYKSIRRNSWKRCLYHPNDRIIF